MTNEQLEAAARKLCELRGVAPDAQLSRPVSMSLAAYQRLDPREWKCAADEIRARLQMDEAIRYAQEQGQRAMFDATIGRTR